MKDKKSSINNKFLEKQTRETINGSGNLRNGNQLRLFMIQDILKQYEDDEDLPTHTALEQIKWFVSCSRKELNDFLKESLMEKL